MTSKRVTYKVELEFMIQLDDKTLPDVKEQVEGFVNEMYHNMEKHDIRVALQTNLEVKELK